MIPARKNGYAIGAFNVQNLESKSAIAEAATEEKSPVIMPDHAKRHQIARAVRRAFLKKNLGRLFCWALQK